MNDSEKQNLLKNVTYKEAIRYYKDKYKSFQKQFFKAASDMGKKGAKKEFNEVIEDLQNSGFSNQAFSLANQLINKVETLFTDDFDAAPFKELVKDEQEQYSKMSEKGRQQLIQEINNLYDINKLTEFVKDSLDQIGLSSNDDSVNLNDLLSWTKSILYSRIFYTAKGSYDPKAFKNSRKSVGAGYFEEALVHKAFSRLGEFLGKKINTMTGATKNKSKDTVFDEYINFLSQGNLNAEFKENINIEKPTVLNQGFGIQSKIWNAPWTLSQYSNVTRRHIAFNSSLLSQLQNLQKQHSWIEGILFLEQHVEEAMGDNVGYVLGKSFFWTYQLIDRFHKEQFYLAFKFAEETHEATSDIGWEKEK